MEIYIVRPGDTTEKIAAQFQVPLSFLLTDNRIPEPNQLVPGQALVIRFPLETYTVRPGDTLFSVAARFGLTLRQLYRRNPILNGEPTVYPGQVLILFLREPVEKPFLSVNGYAYPYIGAQLLRQVLPFLSSLTPFTYGFRPDGELVVLDDARLLAAADTVGTGALMHLSTLTEGGGFSSELAHALLQNDSAQAALIDRIQDVMLEKGYGGLDVDFEYLPATDAEPYARFLARLRSRLAPFGLPVITALAPKTSAAQPGLLYEGHDYTLLGRAADQLLMMTYEWGYTYGPPMAVAPLPNVRRVVDYAVSVIESKKLWLGIPTYGYDWPLPFVQGQTRAVSLSPVQAVALAWHHHAAILYDETAQSPHFSYRAEDGTAHEVWFEDARSIRAKLALITEYGLYGAGYWNLMRPFPQNWLLLDSLFTLRE